MFTNLWDSLKDWFPHVVAAIAVLVFGLWLSKYLARAISKVIDRSNMDKTVRSFLSHALRIFINIIIVLTAASVAGIPITTFIGMLSAATVAIGLAFKDSLSNVASGILLMLSRPFEVGDSVTIDNFSGVVQSIDIMFSTFLMYDNRMVVMPNSTVISSTIINISVKPTRRLDLVLNIDTDNDPAFVLDVLKDLVAKDKVILKDPKPTIAVREFGKDFFVIICYVWCKSEAFYDLQYRLNIEIAEAFKNQNIHLARTQLVLQQQDEIADSTAQQEEKQQ